MRFVNPLFATTALSFLLTAPALANENAKLFGKMPDIMDVALSPNGEKISFIAPMPGNGNAVYVASTTGGDPTRLAVMNGEPERLSWCEFVTDTRLICEILGIVKLNNFDVPKTKKIAFDIDGNNARAVERRDGSYTSGIRFGSGRIVDWLDEEPNKILLSWYIIPDAYRTNTRFVEKREGLAILKFDTMSGEYKMVEKPNKAADYFLSDGNGNIRVLGSAPVRGATGYGGSRVDWSYRLKGSDKWNDLTEYDSLKDIGFQPIDLDGEQNLLYGLEKVDGRDVLMTIALDETKKKEVIFAHDRYDVSGLARLGYAGRPIGAGYTDEYSRIAYTDKAMEKLSNALVSALPGQPSIAIVDASKDETRLLIRASRDTDPGTYYLFDKSKGALNELMLVRPDLESTKLSEMRPISYTARDGTKIPGYLSLPAGSDGKNLPAIVMPHGGPGARDSWGFDWWVQFYNSEGFAVIQPNFRGSAGYGQDWFQKNGFQSWETAIKDIEDAGRWMISQGIADKERLAIVGWSYGGYAALQSAVHDPSLFKAAVAVAPVTDLGNLKEDNRRFYSYSNIKEFVGDGPHIQAGSPLRNIEKIQIPVQMFHGTKDLNVPVAHARRMHEALRAKKKQSELYIYDGLEHSLLTQEARTDMLTKSAAFLKDKLNK